MLGIMPDRVHRVTSHPAALAGVQAISLVSSHRFPRHSHDEFGIGLMEAGAHRSWSAVGAVTASAGDAIMVNPGEIHDGAPAGDGVRAWRMLYIDPPALERAMEQEFAGAIEMVRPVASDEHLRRLLGGLFDSIATHPADAMPAEEALLRTLAWTLRSHSIAKPRHAPPAPVSRAVARLDAAPEQPVTLADLAALAGLSRFQLLRGFVRELGITPHAYLIQKRVLLAQRLLASGADPVDAALRSGFADQSHLTRAFVRQLGVTPARYRAAISFKTAPRS